MRCVIARVTISDSYIPPPIGAIEGAVSMLLLRTDFLKPRRGQEFFIEGGTNTVKYTVSNYVLTYFIYIFYDFILIEV